MTAAPMVRDRVARVRSNADVLGRPVGHVVRPEDRLPISTEWSGMKDTVNAPPDYDTFFRQYKEYTRWMVSRFGIPPSDLEDVVVEIMVRFLERDSIGVFSRDWATRSKSGRSNFRSYYSRFIVEYAPGKNRNVRKHNGRNVLICDAPMDEDGRTTWLDENAPPSSFEADAVGNMDFAILVSALRRSVDPAYAASVDTIVELALGHPVIKVAELARVLGVSNGEAKAQLETVRLALSGLMGSRG